MRPRYIPARTLLGDRIVAYYVEHRVPGSAIPRRVPIYETIFVDTNKRYPHGSQREAKRRLRQMGGV